MQSDNLNLPVKLPVSSSELIKKLDKLNYIERLRISSIEPNLLSDEIIEFCAESKRFMPHFHIPLQSGSNKILSLMKRRYNTELYDSNCIIYIRFNIA